MKRLFIKHVHILTAMIFTTLLITVSIPGYASSFIHEEYNKYDVPAAHGLMV